MGDTAISWCDKVWNCIRGCTRESPGCINCYAEDTALSVNRRFAGAGRPMPYDGLIELIDGDPRWTGEIRFVPEHLEDPLSWRDPKKIFVASMSDPHHPKLARDHLDQMVAVNSLAGIFGGVHTYQWLTKRAGRQRDYFLDPEVWGRVEVAARRIFKRRTKGHAFERGKTLIGPLPNMWIGTSVENRKHGVPRIDELRDTPACVRFLSIEPLLEDLGDLNLRGIHWVIAGCESGPRARPCHADWLRSIRDQCAAAGVAFFLKQAVREDRPQSTGVRDGRGDPVVELVPVVRLGQGSKRKKLGVIELPYLDGEQHAAFPRSAWP